MPRVIHFEIPADNPDRAVKFYQKIFGWSFNRWEGPMEYWLVETGPDGTPGINGGLTRRQQPGQQTTNVVDVASVDEATKTIDQDAEDTTQTFLTIALEKEYFAAFDPSKARFRTFLRVCLDRFVMNERKAARAQKRGGDARFVGLDFETAEGEWRRQEPRDPGDTDELFRREWIRHLFARTVDAVRDELTAAGKRVQFDLFEAYDLGPEERTTYAELAARFGLSVPQVTNYLYAARRAFRTRALENLRAVSASDEEYRAEARELFGIDVG